MVLDEWIFGRKQVTVRSKNSENLSANNFFIRQQTIFFHSVTHPDSSTSEIQSFIAILEAEDMNFERGQKWNPAEMDFPT